MADTATQMALEFDPVTISKPGGANKNLSTSRMRIHLIGRDMS